MSYPNQQIMGLHQQLSDTIRQLSISRNESDINDLVRKLNTINKKLAQFENKDTL